MPRSLTDSEVDAFLDSKPGWMVFTSQGLDGFPHCVALGYFRDGSDIYLGGRDGTRKVKNVEANPKVCGLVESGRSMKDIKGVMIQGNASIVRYPADFLRLSRVAARQRGTPESELPTEPRPGAVYIRVERVKIISWDYSTDG